VASSYSVAQSLSSGPPLHPLVAEAVAGLQRRQLIAVEGRPVIRAAHVHGERGQS